MPNHKVVFSFSQSANNADTKGTDAGWTETYYDNTDQQEEGARVRAFTLMGLRGRFLTVGWRIYQIRVVELDAQTNPTRRARLYRIGVGEGQGAYVPGSVRAGTQGDAPPWTALVVQMRSANLHQRSALLRGVAEEVISAGGQYNVPPGFTTQFKGFADQLSGQGKGVGAVAWAIRTRGAAIIADLDGVFLAPVLNIPVICDVRRPMLHGKTEVITPPTPVVVTSVLGFQRLNGSWTCTQVVPDPVKAGYSYYALRQKRKTLVEGEYVSGGQLRAWAYSFSNITFAEPQRGTSRKTGRFSGPERGRRSPRGQ